MTAVTAPLSSRAATVGGVALVGAGILLGGTAGGIVAGAALYTAWLLSPRWVAAAALGGLIGVAVVSALDWSGDAAEAARLTGIGVLVAVATAAAVERAPEASAVPRPTEQALRRAGRWIAIATVAAPGFLIAYGLWLAGPGGPLAARDDALVTSLQGGHGLTVVEGGARVASEAAPLAPIIAAFLPGTPERAVLLAWLVTAVAAAALARAVGGFAAALLGGAGAAVLAAAATPRLPEAAAALGIVVAAALLRPEAKTLGRTAGAGVAVGLAMLARPDVGLVVVAAVVWLAVTADIRHPPTLVAGAAIVVGPWLVWYARTFDTWWAFRPAEGEVPGVWLAPLAAIAAAIAVVTAAKRFR